MEEKAAYAMQLGVGGGYIASCANIMNEDGYKYDGNNVKHTKFNLFEASTAAVGL